jgi:tritrans,polycis-undecaprenyl-diphosphate synthase [geranylgeranyl-diphosphate specific]
MSAPKHVAIILDGNRRFAKKLMLEPWKGHEYGEDKVEKLVEWAIELKLSELTLYTFSIQNFNRPKPEFDYLMNLIVKAIAKLSADDKLEKYGIRVQVVGRYTMFPKEVVDAIEKLMVRTENNNKFTINLAMAYGGREEIVDAVKKIALLIESKKLDSKDITESIIQDNLYLSSEPEIIIRTGGEKRTSNFLMWQSYYSEWFFLDKMWPEFTKEDLKEILLEFEQRERRFGK